MIELQRYVSDEKVLLRKDDIGAVTFESDYRTDMDRKRHYSIIVYMKNNRLQFDYLDNKDLAMDMYKKIKSELEVNKKQLLEELIKELKENK